MRHTRLLAASAICASLVAGCTADAGSGGSAGMAPASVSSTAAAATAPESAAPGGSAASSATSAANPADIAFASGMVPHHEQAVEMAEMATTRAGNAQVKKLADQIRAAQGPEIRQMRDWLKAWGATAPMAGSGHGGHGMSGMMSEQDMAELKSASGQDFDRQWLTLMTRHHDGAVEMAEKELSQGANPDAKTLARNIVASQQREIEQMKTLMAS